MQDASLYPRQEGTSFPMLLKDYRKSKGLKQSDFAALVEVEQSTVSCWESGIKIPGRDQIAKIVEATEGAVAWADFDPLADKG